MRITPLLSLILIVLVSSASSWTSGSTKSYDLAGVYEKVELKAGSKSMDTYGHIEEAKAVFVLTKIDAGKYEVELTRIDSNFYQICGTNLYIETKYCYEYATRDEAILSITSSYGYTRGEVIFLD